MHEKLIVGAEDYSNTALLHDSQLAIDNCYFSGMIGIKSLSPSNLSELGVCGMMSCFAGTQVGCFRRFDGDNIKALVPNRQSAACTCYLQVCIPYIFLQHFCVSSRCLEWENKPLTLWLIVRQLAICWIAKT